MCPLDADLSLPERCYSHVLQEWGTYGTTDESYHESQAVLARILGLQVSGGALETMVADAAVDSADFHARPVSSAVRAADGPLLGVHADGKDVPLVQPPAGARPVRLGKGQKRTTKKEAVVTSLSTIAPDMRTPQEVVTALLQDRDRPLEATRPKPVGKELRATLDGKEVTLTRLAERARQREGPRIQERVALTDGAEALQKQRETHFPEHTLVLDIIHATDDLWDAANALLGETHPDRLAWTRTHLEQLLAGDTPAVITALEAAAQDPARTVTQCKALQSTAGYDRRNAPYMHYDTYLARGWPVGTGVVEGACGHLVKDRMEQADRRWTKAGAQAILDLRAFRLNGQGDALLKMVRARFGTVPEALERHIGAANQETLDHLIDRISMVASLDELADESRDTKYHVGLRPLYLHVPITVADATDVIGEDTALRANEAINKPVHDDGGVDDEGGRWR